MNITFNLTTTKFVDINAFHVSGSSCSSVLICTRWTGIRCGWLEGMCVVGGYVWLRCVVDGCGQLDGCGWFWSVCSCGMSGFGWCVVGGMCVVDGGGWLWGVGGCGGV